MIYYIKRKIQQIKNLIRWFPIIWNQYDFDYSYALDVFKFQLQNISKYLKSDRAVCQSNLQRAERIDMIVKLMDKVYNEDYCLEWIPKMEELYGKGCMEFVHKPIEDKPHLTTLTFKYETFDNKEEIRLKSREILNETQAKQDRAHKLLWKLVEHNIQTFWD